MKGQSSTFKKKTIIEIIAVAILVVIAIASIVIFLKDRISSEAIDKDNQTEQIDNNQKADDNSNKNNGQQPDGTNQENNQNSGNNANNNNEDSNNNSNNSNGNNTNNTNNNTGVTNGSNVNEIGETTVERVEEREKLVSRDYWDWWKPTTISVNSTVANIVPALPDITVTKTAETDAGNKLVYAGEKITYTIVVKNNGNQDVEKIEVMDKIPSNTTFDSVENEGIVVKSSKYPEKVVGIKWIITVKAGEEASLKFTVVVDSGVTGTITNKAIANGEESNEENTSIITSNKTSEILRYNKETNKFEAVNVAKIDDEITYTILVTNTGDENGTTKIVDTVPEGTVLKRGSAEGAEISEDHKTVTWNDVEVPAGETVERTFTVIVKDIKSLENKKITNIATVGEKETNETENSTAEINVEKTVIDILRNDESIGLDAEVKEGDVIRYKITVTNTGSEDLTNVIVDEKLEGIELNEKELNIGNLKAGENKEIFASYTVSYEKDIKENVGKIVHNEVKVTGETIPTDPDKEPEKVEDKDEIDTPVADAPSVDINKVATRVKENSSEEFVPVTEKTKVRPGDVIEYVITVTNTGNVTLENIKVTDSLKVTVNGEVKDVDENGTSIIAEIKELSAEAGKNVKTITTYYTVVESDVVEEKTIMNTATVIIPDVPGKDSTEEVPVNPDTSVSGTKTWIDGGKTHNNATEIKLVLTRTSTKPGSVEETVEATVVWNGNTYTFSNLAKYDTEGYLYEYKVSENAIYGYTTNVDGRNFINIMSNIDDKIDVTGTKTWVDGGKTHINSEEIALTLTRISAKAGSVEETVEVTPTWNGNTYTFNGLSKYDPEGYLYTYKVVEDAIYGYTTVQDGRNFTNTMSEINDKIEISGTKTWVDGGKTHNNTTEIILALTRTSTKPGSVEETVEATVVWDGNTYTFSNLSKYDTEGYLYEYKVSENAIDEYTTNVDGRNFINIMSNIDDKINVTGTKTWVDGGKTHINSEEIALTLTRISAKAGSVEETVEVTPTWNGNTYTFNGLSKYDPEGYLYTYKVVEDAIYGYTTVQDGRNFTNTMSEINDKIEISGTKTWVDGGKTHNNATEITLVLTRTSTKTGSVEEKVEATVVWNGNTYTFSNLAKYDTEGYLYEYKVTENAIGGYTTRVDGRNFINIMSNIDDKIDVTGTKTWVDGGKTHINSEEIALTLTRISAKAGSVEETVEVTPTWNGNTYTFNGLSKYDPEGYLYTYKVVEDAIYGYTTVQDGRNFTNTMSEINDKIEISGTKTWVDGGKTHNNTTEIILALTRTSTKPGSVEETVEATVVWNGNTYTFSNLAKYDTEGYLYEYKVSENAIYGYTTNVDGRNFINIMSNIDDKIDVTGTKTWVDGGKTHINSEEIALTLTRISAKAGSVEETVEVTPTWNGNTYTFNGLSKYDPEGYLYTYKVVEDAIYGYTTVQDGRNFTNTMSEINDKIEISGTKTWVDGGKTHNNTTEIILALTRTSTKPGSVEETVEATVVWDGNTYTFSNLSKYDTEGYLYEYKVSENAINEYTTKVDGRNFINIMSNIDETINVTGTKTWVDGGKQHNNATEITLVLTRTSAKPGSVEETVEVTPTWDGNTYTFNGLSKYDAKGYLYTYKVSEVQIKGYDTTTSGNNFTNTMSNISETINVTGTKTWVDGGKTHTNAKEITLVLTRTSTKPGSVEETVVATPTWDGNTYTFNDLAKYDTEGYLYEYKVVENAIDGYTTVQDGRNFINTISDINEKINVIGTKTWIDGGREHDNTTEITLVLTRTSTKPGSVEEIVEVTPTWNGSTYTFSNLTKYDAEGYLYTYKVAENPIDGYTTKVNGYNFTNTMSEINDKIEISGTKIWEDNENAYGTRPTSITVNLLQNGTKVASKKVTSADNWRYSFTDMPKYDAKGYLYTYTVTENAVSNYNTSVNGYNITNRLKLSLTKKATDKNGNIITELIYDSKSEASRKFNYVLTVTGQGQQKVTDVLPSGIVIEDNWSADNVTVTTDTTTGRQKITWNVNLTDDAADELIIPVIATEKVFEGKETESEIVKSVLNLNFHNAGSTGKGNKDYNSKKVNIFLRALGNADPSTDDGYIYAGQTTIATRYINEIKNASGQAKFVSGYDDAKVNSILSTKNTTQIEKMLTDFSKDNESSTGLGKYISGGLPSVATIRQNIKTLYSDKIELTDTQIILWYKVPYSVDEEVARNYVITDKENGNKKLVDKTINLPNCGYHIDGLIVDIKDLGGYIPEGTKVSVKNVANLGKMTSEATVDIIYEKKLSESKVSSQELVSDDIEVNVEENIKQSEEPISKVEKKTVVNEKITKTDITTPSNTTKNVVSNTEQVVEKKDDEKVTASKESKFTVETSED